MKPRNELDAELDHLGAALHHWLCRIRHEAQFWPQFTVLAGEILDEAESWDRLHVLYRLDTMLEIHGKDPLERPRCFESLKYRSLRVPRLARRFCSPADARHRAGRE